MGVQNRSKFGGWGSFIIHSPRFGLLRYLLHGSMSSSFLVAGVAFDTWSAVNRCRYELVSTVAFYPSSAAKAHIPSFMVENPMDGRMARRVKRVYSTLDTFSIRLGVFLRRWAVEIVNLLKFLNTTQASASFTIRFDIVMFLQVPDGTRDGSGLHGPAPLVGHGRPPHVPARSSWLLVRSWLRPPPWRSPTRDCSQDAIKPFFSSALRGYLQNFQHVIFGDIIHGTSFVPLSFEFWNLFSE
jgi:hypothetical protein